MTSTSAVISNRDNANPMETLPNSTVSSVGVKGTKIMKGKTSDAKSGNDDPSWVLALKNKMLFNEVGCVVLLFCNVRYVILSDVLLRRALLCHVMFCYDILRCRIPI
jgi:hypothetical protein